MKTSAIRDRVKSNLAKVPNRYYTCKGLPVLNKLEKANIIKPEAVTRLGRISEDKNEEIICSAIGPDGEQLHMTINVTTLDPERSYLGSDGSLQLAKQSNGKHNSDSQAKAGTQPDANTRGARKRLLSATLSMLTFDGHRYEFAHQTVDDIDTIREYSQDIGCQRYIVGSLTYEIDLAFALSRIVFNGFIKRTNIEHDTQENVFAHIRLLKTAAADAFDYRVRVDPDLLCQQIHQSSVDTVQQIDDIWHTTFEDRIDQPAYIQGHLSVDSGPKQFIRLWASDSKIFHDVNDGLVELLNCENNDHNLGYERLICYALCGHLIHIARSEKKQLKSIVWGWCHSAMDYSSSIIDIRLEKDGTPVDFASLESFEDLGPEHSIILKGFVSKEYTITFDCPFIDLGQKYTAIVINGFQGFASVQHENYGRNLADSYSCLLALEISDHNELCQQLANLTLCGGKGYSLMSLSQLASESNNVGEDFFKVPSGVIVTSRAYELWLAHNHEARHSIDQLQSLVWRVAALSANTSSLSNDYVSPADRIAMIKKKCDETIATIVASQLPSIVRNSVRARLISLFGDEAFNDNTACLFAVRSSATGEDAGDTSAAGQMKTLLGLRTFDQIASAILECWASQFNINAVTYKNQNGQTINVPMAVVVQQLVNCDAAGVATTCDPVSGHPLTTVITANYGLGESVVGALCGQPDTFRVRVNYDARKNLFYIDDNDHNGARRIEAIIGDKVSQIRPMLAKAVEATETTESVANDEKLRHVSCLSDTQIIELTKRLLWLKRRLGNQDREIEWGVVKTNGYFDSTSSSSSSSSEDRINVPSIFLFQSRPLTNLLKLNNFEIDHENDNAFSSPLDILSRANLGEVYPGATSTLGSSYLLNVIAADSTRHRGKPFEPYHSIIPYSTAVIGSSCQVVYLMRTYTDMCARFLSQPDMAQGMQSMIGFGAISEFDIRIFRERVHPSHPVTENGVARRVLMDLGVASPVYWYVKLKYKNLSFDDDLSFIQSLSSSQEFLELQKKATRASVNIGQIIDQIEEQSVAKSELSKAIVQLYEHLKDSTQAIPDAWEMHIISTLLSMFLNGMALAILAKRETPLEPFAEQNLSDFSRLMTHVCPTESSQMPLLLSKISDAIEDKEKFKQFTSKQAYEYLSTTKDNCGIMFRDFLEKNAHRCYKEFDVGSLTWRDDPSYIVKSLCAIVRSGKRVTHANDKANDIKNGINNEEVEKILSQVTSGKGLLTKVVLPRARNAVTRRERSKSLLIWTIDRYRLAFRRLGELLCLTGKLPSVGRIFHLRPDEIERLIYERSPGLVSKSRARENRIKLQDKFQYPTVDMTATELIKLYEDVITCNEDAPKSSSSDSDDSTIVNKVIGITSCAGFVTARVCIIDNIGSIDELQPNDILVTYSIDVSWTAYFPLVSGIITEVGAIISHGAVVAREYGIPTLCSAIGATSKFKTGDIITLDATKGLCYLSAIENGHKES